MSSSPTRPLYPKLAGEDYGSADSGNKSSTTRALAPEEDMAAQESGPTPGVTGQQDGSFRPGEDTDSTDRLAVGPGLDPGSRSLLGSGEVLHCYPELPELPPPYSKVAEAAIKPQINVTVEADPHYDDRRPLDEDTVDGKACISLSLSLSSALS